MRLSYEFLIVAFVLNAFIDPLHSDSCPAKDPEKERRAFLWSGNAKIDHYNIVLMGATGNLATKYLWKALYEVFRRHYSEDSINFQIYATSRKEPYAARRQIGRRLLALVNCEDEAEIQRDEDCMTHKKKFIESIQYHQLKTEGDFKILGDKLYENSQSIYGIDPGSSKTYERGRLIYMSIPPSAYASISNYTHTYLRPKVGRPWMRVVLEKPFGHSLESAKSLARVVSEYFSDSELYRIDHYLAKTAVKEMLSFRYRNRAVLEPRWNRDYIERIEIVMKEKEDVAGRTDFYNDVGVICDVMQNHMTELLALIACDLPTDSGNITSLLAAKVKLLTALHLADPSSILLGQYTTYNIEWLRNQEQKLKDKQKQLQKDRAKANQTGEAGDKSKKVDPKSEELKMVLRNTTKTPTQATVVLEVDNERWRDVPFVLTSGKKLDEKTSYVRVVFRPSRLCMRSANMAADTITGYDDDGSGCAVADQRQYVTFTIGSGSKHKSSVSLSRGLIAAKRLVVPAGWTLDKNSSDSELRYTADVDIDPYITLLESVTTAARHMFVSTSFLLESWRAWTPVLAAADGLTPRQYMGLGRDTERLDVHLAPPGSVPRLRYWVTELNVPHYSADASSTKPGSSEIRQVTDQFRNSPLVTGTLEQVVERLTDDIVRLIGETSETFHLALSGGQSPVPLLHRLAANPAIPWRRVHIWLVDERCDDGGSNFNTLERHLLGRIRGNVVPYRNIHPILSVQHLTEVLTDDQVYEATIRQTIGEPAIFDMVVLGVGADGHTAGIFPTDMPHDDQGRLVEMRRGDVEHPRRVTLTLTALNAARNGAVLVTGTSKNSILRTVEQLRSDDPSSVAKFPIVGVNLTSGHLTWYIDHDALFTEQSTVLV